MNDHNTVSPIRLILFMFVSLINCFVVTVLCFKIIYHWEIILGWLLALIFSLSGLLLKRSAVQSDIRKFFAFLFIFTPLNIAVFFWVVIYVINHFPIYPRPFITSIFTAYFTFLVYNVMCLRYLRPSGGIS